METTDHLFVLIKSLNKSEKGYFKKYANFHVLNNENNYAKIFNAIDQQQLYDQPKLLKKFKGERFINQFSVAKNYLYEMVLQSLEAYHKTNNSELRSLLTRAEILMDKGLHAQAKKILKRVKKIAVEREMFSYISEINFMEQEIHRLDHDVKWLKENSELIIDEINNSTKHIENIGLYEKLKNELHLYCLETSDREDEKKITTGDLFLKNALFQNENNALSSRTKVLFTELKLSYYECMGQFSESYVHSVDLLNLTKKNPKINEHAMLLALYRHCLQCSNMGRNQEALETISQMELSGARTGCSLKIMHAKLTACLYASKINECMELIAFIKKNSDNYKHSDRLLKEEMYWKIISTLILSREFKAALNWLARLKLEDLSIRKKWERIGKMIEIIVHYELGNLDIIDYRLKSMQRFVTTKNKLLPLEDFFLSFFRYLINPTHKEDKALFSQAVKSFLESQAPVRIEHNLLTYVLMTWLKTQTENSKLQGVIKTHPGYATTQKATSVYR